MSIPQVAEGLWNHLVWSLQNHSTQDSESSQWVYRADLFLLSTFVWPVSEGEKGD